ncbi:hypothetical protein KCU94_g3989, partial [Aureobasidium melanogenum]
MNELSSLMLQLDVADIGEPSFTLSSNKAREEIFPNIFTIKQNLDSYNGAGLSTDNQKQLVKCFAEQFNRFHQFLDPHEAESLILSIPDAKDSDMSFRNSALLAVAAFCSDVPLLNNLQEHFFTQAESLVLQSIREKPSDLVYGIQLDCHGYWTSVAPRITRKRSKINTTITRSESDDTATSR